MSSGVFQRDSSYHQYPSKFRSIVLFLIFIVRMNLLDIKNIIKECFEEEHIILENLILKRHEDKLVVVSDAGDRKSQSAETFRNKEKLKAAGFRWDGNINSWTIDQSQLRKAQEVLSGISKTPIERFIDKVEEIPEFLQNTDNLSKKDELGQKIDGFIEQLSTAVDAASVSASVKNFLAFNAKFRGYSFHNTLLIYLQNPKATKVAGFKQWEEKFHRRVKKGAKGISILAPITVKKKEDDTQKATVSPTPASPLAGTGPDDGSEKDKPQQRYMRFMAVTVFDIADTEPIDERGNVTEPEWHGSNEPNEKANELFQCAVEMATDMGIKVGSDGSRHGEQGWSAGDHINISSDIDGVNKAATTIHEIAHELLHHKKTSPFYIGDEESGTLSKEVKELQAESVSFVVIKYYDLPAEHQATYIALWKGNKDSVRQNLTTIKKAADFIIGELDKIWEEKSKKEKPPAAPMTVNESVASNIVHLFTINNDAKGLKYIDDLRKLIKPQGYRLVLRGRGHRYGKGKITKTNFDNRYQSRLPLELAERIAVYLADRQEPAYKEPTEPVGLQ